MRNRARFVLGFLCVCALPLLSSCASKGWVSTPVALDPAVITVQPLSQIVAPGQTATFSVTATSDKPLTYQWTENGPPIPGATGSSYTTPPAVLGVGGSTLLGTFAVVVSNSSVAFASQPATLTIGPRPPKPGDLRYLLYQQVAPAELSNASAPLSDISYLENGSYIFLSATNAIGTPLSMGSANLCDGIQCVWFGYAQYLSFPVGYSPVGFSMHYQPGTYSYFASDMQSTLQSNMVLTSLDFEPAINAYAVSWVQTTQPEQFDHRFDPVIPPGTGQESQIQAQAALDGMQSRIITAVSFDASGSADLISYGWQGDFTTVYEAQTVLVPPGSNVISDISTAATNLANSGYFISAFGGNDTNGYVLVGMRVQGDSLPRPIQLHTCLGSTCATTPAVNPTWANLTMVTDLREFASSLFVYEQ